jgi:hypothetical protein
MFPKLGYKVYRGLHKAQQIELHISICIRFHKWGPTDQAPALHLTVTRITLSSSGKCCVVSCIHLRNCTVLLQSNFRHNVDMNSYNSAMVPRASVNKHKQASAALTRNVQRHVERATNKNDMVRQRLANYLSHKWLWELAMEWNGTCVNHVHIRAGCSLLNTFNQKSSLWQEFTVQQKDKIAWPHSAIIISTKCNTKKLCTRMYTKTRYCQPTVMLNDLRSCIIINCVQQNRQCAYTNVTFVCVRSRNHCCRGKAISIIYSVCVCVCL